MEKPKKGIAVDGSTRGNPGPSEYRAIDLETNKVIFHKKIGISTNNITEFIGLCHAVLLNLENETTIYTDSQTALSWLKSKSVNSSLPKNELTQIANDYLSRCLKQIENLKFSFDGISLKINNLTISKWYTSEYGEIPADFNLKK